jgi:hypothetical protein
MGSDNVYYVKFGQSTNGSKKMKGIYSVFDKKAQEYAEPFVDVTDATALRKVQDLVENHKDHPMSRYAEDYELVKLGSWDATTGIIEMDPMDLIPLAKLKVE